MEYLIKAFSLLLIFNASFNHCIEMVEPEIFLRPRNFNPHPYKEDSIERSGPVLFPDSALSLPHPYARVADRRRGKENIYRAEDNLIVPNAFRALAKHAATKVLNRKKLYDNRHRLTPDKQYEAFTFTPPPVSHAARGDSGGRHYVSGVGEGEASEQLVSYITDNERYNADVSYNGNNDPLTISSLHEQRLNQPFILTHPLALPVQSVTSHYHQNNNRYIDYNPIQVATPSRQSIFHGNLRRNDVLYSHSVQHDYVNNGGHRIGVQDGGHLIQDGGHFIQHGGHRIGVQDGGHFTQHGGHDLPASNIVFDRYY